MILGFGFNLQGLKTTLQILDEELPRNEDSISNRQLLVKELHIEKIMKKNKVISRFSLDLRLRIQICLMSVKISSVNSDSV